MRKPRADPEGREGEPVGMWKLSGGGQIVRNEECCAKDVDSVMLAECNQPRGLSVSGLRRTCVVEVHHLIVLLLGT
jgi:hypothetical protein